MQRENLSKWYSSNANPANKLRDIFTLSFKQGQKINTRGVTFDVSNKPSGFRDHVTQSFAINSYSSPKYSNQSFLKLNNA